MKTRNYWLLIFLIGTIFFASQSVFAQSRDPDAYNEDVEDIVVKTVFRDYLVGLKKVKISIEALPTELMENGVTADQLQTEAEIRLRRAEIYDEKATSHVSIVVSVYDRNDYSIAYESIFTLHQPARLQRNNLAVSSETWRRFSFGTSGKSRLQAHIRENVGKYIDKFIEDLREANSQAEKKDNSAPARDQSLKPSPPPPTINQDDSPFTATYVGGNRPPTVEVFNDSNRTLYLDLGQGKMTAYTILSGSSEKINLTEGSYNFKASAPRVKTLKGQEVFNKGYAYTWRFTIRIVPR